MTRLTVRGTVLRARRREGEERGQVRKREETTGRFWNDLVEKSGSKKIKKIDELENQRGYKVCRRGNAWHFFVSLFSPNCYDDRKISARAV